MEHSGPVKGTEWKRKGPDWIAALHELDRNAFHRQSADNLPEVNSGAPSNSTNLAAIHRIAIFIAILLYHEYDKKERDQNF